MYLRLNGADGLKRVSEVAVLNANWIKERLRGTYDLPYDRTVMHECVVSAKSLHHDTGLGALDVAKRLIELGFHPPTVHFPLIVDEALMIEPTETESPQTVAALAEAFIQVAKRHGRPATPMSPRPPPARRRSAGWTRRGPPGSSS